MNLAEYQELKDAAERKKRAADRARGAYDAALTRLKTDWACSTIKEARAKLESLQAEEKELSDKLEARLAKFQSKWKHLLS